MIRWLTSRELKMSSSLFLMRLASRLGLLFRSMLKFRLGTLILTVCLHAEAAAVQEEAADAKCPDETGRLVFYI